MKFVGLVGSNAEQSYNRKLLEFIRREFKLKFELEVMEIDEVPLFNQESKWDDSFQLRLLYNKITRADGVIIATPEHNHTITAALKNVLTKGLHVLKFTSARSWTHQGSTLIPYQAMNSY